jgi:cytochrome P450
LESWVVHDPADVRAVLLDPVAFPPDNALSAHARISPVAMRTLAAVGFSLPPALANNAGPSHRPIRRLVAGSSAPPASPPLSQGSRL